MFSMYGVFDAYVTEYKHYGFKRVTSKSETHNGGQTVYALTHIRTAAYKVNLPIFVLEHINSPYLNDRGNLYDLRDCEQVRKI